MKVWIISVGEPLPTDGVNVRLRRMGNLARYLSEHSHKVEWFSASFDHYKKIQRVSKETTYNLSNNYNIHLVKVPGYKKNISLARIFHHWITARKIRRKMESILETPDIIIASMEPLENSSISVKFSKKHNIPSIIDVRDLWPEIYYEVIHRSLYPILNMYVWWTSKVLTNTMKQASSIVGLSEDFLEYGLKYARRSKCKFDSVIPIGYPNYDYSEFKGKYKELYKKFNIEENDFIISFLGNFGNQFNFKPIIEAANILKAYRNIKFVLCGTGIQLENIKAQCENLNVIFPGWIEKDDIAILTSNSHLGIAPYIDSQNYRKNTPNKFGEYLSASLPPLLSVHGLMERLVQKYRCGEVYADGKNLSEKILFFYNNRKILNTYAANARNLYEERFNAEIINKIFLEHIQLVCCNEKE